MTRQRTTGLKIRYSKKNQGFGTIIPQVSTSPLSVTKF